MSKLKADLLLVLVAALWGSSFIVIKNVAGTISPFGFVALRFLFAALILFVFFFKRLKDMTPEIWKRGAIIGALTISSLVLQMEGLRFTSASNSAFITVLSVVFVPLCSAVILKKNPTKSNILGVILAFVGVFLLTGAGRVSLNFGNLLTLIAAGFVTAHIITVDKFTRDGKGLLLGINQIFCVAIISGVIWMVTDFNEMISLQITYHLIVAVVVTGVFCTAIAFTLQVYMQQYVSPVAVAIILMLEPVFALGYALIIPGVDGTVEILTFLKVSGSLLVILGTVFSELDILKKLTRKDQLPKSSNNT